MKFSDLYFIDINGNHTIKNKLGITTRERYDQIEKEYMIFASYKIRNLNFKGAYDVKHYKLINKLLVDDLIEWGGQFRTWNVAKKERVLNGLSVNYASYDSIEYNLKQGIDLLKGIDFSNKDLKKISIELADAWNYIWQTHPFPECNTRTTAWFIYGYLSKKGVSIDFTYLNQNQGLFRDALALYTTFKKENQKPLENMIYNALIGKEKRV